MPARTTGDAARLRALDDARQVALQLLDRQAAQRVVAAERHDQHAHVAVERPVEPAQPAGRRVARDAGVDDLVAQALRRRARCCSSAGYASSGASPRPAVRLSPRTTMRGRESGAAGAPTPAVPPPSDAADGGSEPAQASVARSAHTPATAPARAITRAPAPLRGWLSPARACVGVPACWPPRDRRVLARARARPFVGAWLSRDRPRSTWASRQRPPGRAAPPAAETRRPCSRILAPCPLGSILPSCAAPSPSRPVSRPSISSASGSRDQHDRGAAERRHARHLRRRRGSRAAQATAGPLQPSRRRAAACALRHRGGWSNRAHRRGLSSVCPRRCRAAFAPADR